MTAKRASSYPTAEEWIADLPNNERASLMESFNTTGEDIHDRWLAAKAFDASGVDEQIEVLRRMVMVALDPIIPTRPVTRREVERDLIDPADAPCSRGGHGPEPP